MNKMPTVNTPHLDVDAVLERLKEIYGLVSDADLARFLDMTPSGVSTWRRRGTLDLSFIAEKCMTTPTADLKMVNLHWLIVGSGSASIETVQSIIVDEISRRTPDVMGQVVTDVVDRLKTEGVILSSAVSRTVSARSEEHSLSKDKRHKLNNKPFRKD